jgi:hypothetical protein
MWVGRLDGEVALITDGGRGFRRTIAEALARVDAAVEGAFGPATMLVNHAGVAGPYGPIAQTDPDQVKWSDHLGAEVRSSGVRAFATQPGDAPTGFAHRTINDPGVRKHLRGMLRVLDEWVRSVDPGAVLRRCGEMVVALAERRYHRLAGRYREVEWDWDEKLGELRREPA